MSTIHRFIGNKSDFNWEDVDLTIYDDKEGGPKFATKRVMISEEKDNAKIFIFRYFRILPGGYSTIHDEHEHDHGVLILHGQCKVLLNGVEQRAGPMDVIYVSPGDVHHFINDGDEPLGFLCVIPNKKLLK